MILGFTGTRNGMTPSQRRAFLTVLTELLPERLLHGACVGADEDAARLARLYSPWSVRVVALPGKFADGRANRFRSAAALADSQEVEGERKHLERNRDIVRRSDLLVACPCLMGEQVAGGTWRTV